MALYGAESWYIVQTPRDKFTQFNLIYFIAQFAAGTSTVERYALELFEGPAKAPDYVMPCAPLASRLSLPNALALSALQRPAIALSPPCTSARCGLFTGIKSASRNTITGSVECSSNQRKPDIKVCAAATSVGMNGAAGATICWKVGDEFHFESYNTSLPLPLPPDEAARQ